MWVQNMTLHVCVVRKSRDCPANSSSLAPSTDPDRKGRDADTPQQHWTRPTNTSHRIWNVPWGKKNKKRLKCVNCRKKGCKRDGGDGGERKEEKRKTERKERDCDVCMSKCGQRQHVRNTVWIMVESLRNVQQVHAQVYLDNAHFNCAAEHCVMMIWSSYEKASKTTHSTHER